jgi:hypothetical protein
VTPERLSAILQRQGKGEVSTVDLSEWPVLKINYSTKSTQSPARLFLKITKEGASSSPDVNNKRQALGSTGQNEVAFYQLASSRQAELPMILKCYDAAYSLEDHTAHLLLHDYSQTHLEPNWTVPVPRHREEIMRCSAQFHSTWWQHSQLRQLKRTDLNINLNCQNEVVYQTYVRNQQEAFPFFVNFMGEALSVQMRKLYERTLEALPGFWSRYLAPRLESLENVTLLHGDSHWQQFVCPVDPAKNPTYMADMECFHVGLPAADLAYRLCFSWTVEERWQMEDDLIRLYLEELQANEVSGYSYDTFRQDYKLSVIFLTLYFQYFFSHRFANRADLARKKQDLPNWWWFEYGCTSGNFLDLGCEELF